MITAIVQARMGSTRLPGKIMMKVRDKPLLYYIINQIRHSKKINKLVIATTDTQQDDQIIKFVNLYDVEAFRGNEENVLDRYYQCAKKYDADIIVRITSDCPLIDPQLIDKCITEFENNNFDYFSNINKKEGETWTYHLSGFPMGFAVEVFTFDALEQAWKNAKKPSEKEHVTQFILNNPKLFRIGNIENYKDYSNIRLTVDHQIDFDLIKIVIEYFPEGEIFNIEKIMTFFNKNPHLQSLNSHLKFNEGFLKSLEKDETEKYNSINS